MSPPRDEAVGQRPSRRARAAASSRTPGGPERPHAVTIPRDAEGADIRVDGDQVHLTNLAKPFWRELGVTKGDLLQYYADIAPALLPHVRGRAMVMKRYPNGAHGDFFFMKRAPTPRPAWIRTCAIDHGSKGLIDFPVIDDVKSLLWVVNLGCIDLNPWYGGCANVNQPDYLHFDLDPGQAPFDAVVESALLLRVVLEHIGMPTYVKTSGSKGLHVYVPLVVGPTQKQVWTVAKAVAVQLARSRPALMTAEYAVAKRPAGRVLVDYNQNAWGRTLASVYSVRPRDVPSVSTPVTWKELEKGLTIEDFTLADVPARVRKKGDLWAPLAPEATPRFDLGRFDLRGFGS